VLIEYIEVALKRARYKIIDDEEPYYGEVAERQGVWATVSLLRNAEIVSKR